MTTHVWGDPKVIECVACEHCQRLSLLRGSRGCRCSSRLTATETAVIAMAGNGMTNRQIAGELGLDRDEVVELHRRIIPKVTRPSAKAHIVCEECAQGVQPECLGDLLVSLL